MVKSLNWKLLATPSGMAPWLSLTEPVMPVQIDEMECLCPGRRPEEKKNTVGTNVLPVQTRPCT